MFFRIFNKNLLIVKFFPKKKKFSFVLILENNAEYRNLGKDLFNFSYLKIVFHCSPDLIFALTKSDHSK